MAAKNPARKAVAKSVQNSGTTKAKSSYTAAQRTAYRAAYQAAVRSAGIQARANAIANSRIQAARAREAKRAVYRARSTAKIVTTTYLQGRYGNQRKPYLGVPLKGRLFAQKSIQGYVQSKYGKKTYSLTKGGGKVRLGSTRVQKGKVVAVNRPARRKAQTSRTNYAAAAAGNAAAHRVSPRAKAPVVRKAAGRQGTVNPEWITAGNDEGAENCVAVAFANHLLYHTGKHIEDKYVEYLTTYCTYTIPDCLRALDNCDAWAPLSLSEYGRVDPAEAKAGMIVGFSVLVEGKYEPHCGLLLEGNRVVSWGEAIPMEAAIEEAWSVEWMTTS